MGIPELFAKAWAEDEEAEEYSGPLTEREEEWIVRQLVRKGLGMISEADRCESPIERLMMMALDNILVHADILGIYTDCVLDPQHEIKIDGKTYRIDIMVAVRIHGTDCSVAVECDGHDFHEKTKAQARRDRKRDRLIQLAGYPVLRFTGSEIWEDPRKCARQVVRFINEEWVRRHYEMPR